MSRAIDANGRAGFPPALLDWLRIDLPFADNLSLLLDERNRPFQIFDTMCTPDRFDQAEYYRRFYSHSTERQLSGDEIDPECPRFRNRSPAG